MDLFFSLVEIKVTIYFFVISLKNTGKSMDNWISVLMQFWLNFMFYFDWVSLNILVLNVHFSDKNRSISRYCLNIGFGNNSIEDLLFEIFFVNKWKSKFTAKRILNTKISSSAVRFTSIWWIGRFLPNRCSRLVLGLLAKPGNSRIVRKLGVDLLSLEVNSIQFSFPSIIFEKLQLIN